MALNRDLNPLKSTENTAPNQDQDHPKNTESMAPNRDLNLLKSTESTGQNPENLRAHAVEVPVEKSVALHLPVTVPAPAALIGLDNTVYFLPVL